MNTEYNILIGKLDRFIRKFYKNELIKGLIISLIIYLIVILFSSVIEYFGHFSIPARTFIFYTSLAAWLLVFYKFILIPLLHFFRIGKVINHKQAASIISRHFTDIKDQLLNILELTEISNQALYSHELVLAAIDQKIKTVSPFDFELAVDFRTNFKYLKRFGIAAFLFAILLIFYPSIVTEGTGRILNHRTFFVPEAPFHFIIENKDLKVEKGKDIEIKVKIEGKYLPPEARIEFGGGTYLMKKLSKSDYSYSIKNVNNSFAINFLADEVVSDAYEIEVLPAPSVLDFILTVKVPAYTGESDKVLKNIGDATLPYGSVCRWEISGQDADTIGFLFGDSLKFYAKSVDEKFFLQRSMLKSYDYRIFGYNSYFHKNDLLKFSITVIPDQYPSISFNQMQDSSNISIFYFGGQISDDYGFTRLALKIKTPGSTDSIYWLPVSQNINNQEFSYAFDFATLGRDPGQKIEYYFEVWDNDGISGAKSTRSSIYEYSIPTRSELDKIEKELKDAVNDKLEANRKLTEKLQRNLKDIKQKAMNEKSSDWENSRKVDDLLKMHQQLEQNFNELVKQNQKMNQLDRSFNELNQDILDKQKEIEELMNNLFDDELKKLMDELRELSKEFDKDKLKEVSDKLDLTYEDLKDQLDKDLELLKRYNVEDKVFKKIDELKDLAKKQEKLSDETRNEAKAKEDLLKNQDEIQKEFDRISNEYKDAQKENSELKEPMDLKDFQKEMDQISNEMKDGKEKMANNQNSKASGKQKKAAEQMENMAEQMEQMMQQQMEQEEEDNTDMLKQILENLVSFSFDQENLIARLKGKDMKDPQVALINQKQIGLRDNLSVIRDSLMKLASKTPQIGKPINKELLSIEKNIASSIENLKDRKSEQAMVNQQLVMTSANNLSLLLAEVLKQMQEQPQDGKPSSCKKSSKGKKKGQGMPSMSEMRSMQQGMKEQMQSMIDQMKKGQGGTKQDKNAQNKRLAQMMAQQEIFNQMMNEMMMNGGVGSQAQKLLQEIKSLMDQNQRDIVNRNITPETMNRQNQIVTRMLEAENSENQREVDPKRESREMTNLGSRKVKPLETNFKKEKSYSELLSRSQLSLGSFYRKKYKDYLVKINE